MDYKKNEKMYFHYMSNNAKSSVKQSDIFQIYEKLIDDESRRIFSNRLLFSLTNDWSFIRNMLIECGNWSELHKRLTLEKDVFLYIYGAGISGGRLPLIFPEYPWKGYIDKNKEGQICNGLPVYGIAKCSKFSNNTLILVSNMSGEGKIKEKLLEIGIPQKNIIIYKDYIRAVTKNMYFEKEYLDKNNMKNRLFVDAGAFDGTDTIHFFEWVEGTNAGAIVFEADSNNFEIVKKNLSVYSQVNLYNQGLSDISGQEFFLSGKGEMSSFSSEGDKAIYMDSLDNVASNLEIGYIKMDIEGFEKKALIGATKIISKQKPMLGISIYHKREDIWELPRLILSMNSGYRFLLRHYSLGVVDTVLYAF